MQKIDINWQYPPLPPSGPQRNYAYKRAFWALTTRLPQIPDDAVFDSLGSLNNTYIVPLKVQPVLIGRYDVTIQMDWKEVENWVIENFYQNSTDNRRSVRSGTNPNRHIDMERVIRIQGRNYMQSIEIKKTSGCTHGRLPNFLKSSKKQLYALLYSKLKPRTKQLLPSIYVVVSVDYSRSEQTWINSVFVIPVLEETDWGYIDTSDINFIHPRTLYDFNVAHAW